MTLGYTLHTITQPSSVSLSLCLSVSLCLCLCLCLCLSVCLSLSLSVSLLFSVALSLSMSVIPCSLRKDQTHAHHLESAHESAFYTSHRPYNLKLSVLLAIS